MLLMMNQGRAQAFGPKDEVLATRAANASRRQSRAAQGRARSRELRSS